MTIATDPQYEKPRTEHLDVVLLKLGVSEFTAKRMQLFLHKPINPIFLKPYLSVAEVVYRESLPVRPKKI